MSSTASHRPIASRLQAVLSFLLPCLVLAVLPAAADTGDLGSARLQIAGTWLTISPAEQTVPFGTPTIVETHFEGYDADREVLPSGLRVLGELDSYSNTSCEDEGGGSGGGGGGGGNGNGNGNGKH